MGIKLNYYHQLDVELVTGKKHSYLQSFGVGHAIREERRMR
jgi:hypothetical protein